MAPDLRFPFALRCEVLLEGGFVGVTVQDQALHGFLQYPDCQLVAGERGLAVGWLLIGNALPLWEALLKGEQLATMDEPVVKQGAIKLTIGTAIVSSSLWTAFYTS